ncbi:MAG: hypothetical protein JWQ83_403 [Lacunisphaera sp.]|nr:hypothetical protein [Lacunisphaera sp.]
MFPGRPPLHTSAAILEKDQPGADGLTARQRSEIDYHSGYAARHSHLADTPVDLDVVTSAARRPWNAYWAFYDLIRNTDVRGKRVLVPGCGFGEDAVRLAELGAEVHGIDLSPEIVEIARRRAGNFARTPVRLNVMPCETIAYPDGFFDAVVLVNILHHVDIARTMTEVRRVAKPGAEILGLEMYTHSLSQRLRESAFMTKVVYPRVVGKIYKGDPYITPDERKINEDELSDITRGFLNRRLDYFSIFAERLFSSSQTEACKADRRLAQILGGLGRFVAGRVVFSGTWPG